MPGSRLRWRARARRGRGRPSRIQRHDGYWLVVGVAAPGAVATTLGPVILMRPRGVGNRRLLRHELVHVAQWRHLGVGGFLMRYLGDYVRWRLRCYPHQAAYRRIGLEIEAEWQARRAVPPSPGRVAGGPRGSAPLAAPAARRH